jgi:hypothetical protein
VHEISAWTCVSPFFYVAICKIGRKAVTPFLGVMKSQRCNLEGAQSSLAGRRCSVIIPVFFVVVVVEI